MKFYITLFNILLITLLIFFSINGFYKILSTKLGNDVRMPEISKKQSALQENKISYPLSHYKTIIKRNLFNTKEKIQTQELETKKEERVEALKLTDLKLKLWGTVTGIKGKSYAVIQEYRKKKQRLYAVGDTIQKAVIKKILREKIILNVDGKDEILEIEEVTSTKKGSKRDGSRTSSSRRISKKTINIKRTEIENAIKNINNLMKQARIRPHFRNGKPDGLVLTRIRQRSIFKKLGLRSGDVILGVDGEDIRAVDDALTFYNRLKSSSNVNIQIKRRGRLRELEYNIR